MIRIGIIGYGKIARDQHVPAIEADEAFELAATVSRKGKGHPGQPCFTSHKDMIREAENLDAAAICTPPSARYEIARDCILAGLHCLLEKPPGMSLGEVEELARLAAHRRISLFTTWHAQHADSVEAAAGLLARRRLRSMHIHWREDVRKWHPGQAWIWEPGGFGVFDPGINALSIATRICPGALFVRSAELDFPAGRQQPIAARLVMESPAADGPIHAEFDWRETEGETWTIEVVTDEGGTLTLSGGGAQLEVDGETVETEGLGEYPSLYRQFAGLIERSESHVDLDPLRLTAEAFLLGRRNEVEAFEE
ncbi:MAG TPA: Gfo/Idh/MocA family oxidoreductase [Allosphingosinicella sp.]|nr:Gfo/Idh/MocA family oxidoreductase [Allosphingosinicella sp.]